MTSIGPIFWMSNSLQYFFSWVNHIFQLFSHKKKIYIYIYIYINIFKWPHVHITFVLCTKNISLVRVVFVVVNSMHYTCYLNWKFLRPKSVLLNPDIPSFENFFPANVSTYILFFWVQHQNKCSMVSCVCRFFPVKVVGFRSSDSRPQWC